MIEGSAGAEKTKLVDASMQLACDLGFVSIDVDQVEFEER